MTSQKPMKVLLVEADPELRNQLMRYLAQAFSSAEIHPYDPLISGRPDAEFSWSRFDVLLLDFQLGPDENGLEWLRIYKRDVARFPATILLTSDENEDVAVRALRYGAHDFLRKQGLTAAKVAESVADALNVRYRESSAENSLTINSSKFSKSFFYGQLDLAFEEAEVKEKRALLLIRVDGYDALRKSLGVLAMEDVTRHLANVGMDLFNFSKYRPRATRFSDATIGILVGGFDDDEVLENALREFCHQIGEQPSVVNDTKIPVTVSIGAVIINSRSLTVYDLFEQAEHAVFNAAKTDGSSYVVTNPEPMNRNKNIDRELVRELNPQDALRENRIQPMFGPIAHVSDRPTKLDLDEFFEIDAYFISNQGERVPVSAVLAQYADESLWKLTDRWKIRECVGRLLSPALPEDRRPAFMIDLSDSSSTDEKLPHWVDELFRYHAERERRGEILIEISPVALMRQTRVVVSICNQLQAKHGFRFALKDIADPAMCKVCLAQLQFDLVILSQSCTESLIEEQRLGSDCGKLLEFAEKNGLCTLARGIEDANALRTVISAGVDYVHGRFIAPEQEEIEAAIGIETVHLTESTFAGE